MSKGTPLAVGHWVKVTPLGKNAEIVERLSRGRYRVRIGALTVICQEHELIPTNAPRTSRRTPEPGEEVARSARLTPPPTQLDLHGLTVPDAIAKLASWLDRAALANLEKVTVIHGHGTGRIQRAVHEYLAQMRIVRRFRINELNRGETEVFL
jgi:DNA mismatch repair protein MutS2